MKRIVAFSIICLFSTSASGADLRIKTSPAGDKLEIFRTGESTPVVTQNARADFRPFLHPIVAPDGKGVLTEYSPGHHKHQTGLYWGFTRVNGRDYFHHPEGDYWKRVSATVLNEQGAEVKWQTIYDLLDANGQAVLQETQTWTMHEHDGEFVLELEWKGDAKVDVTIGKYDYGGLFLRMPWRQGIAGEVVNGARQRGARAEGQRAPWVDVGMQVEGRDDLAHIAIFDHAKNPAYPQPWRVDGQMGVGPVRARLGDWPIAKGESTIIKHQLVAYTGALNDVELTNKWGEFSGERGTWALWGLAQKEGREAKFLTPDAAVKEMTLKDGFQVNAFANEPMITQPMAFCWDDRGRMWIAENRDYESRGRGFANSGDSRILILEDTDHDGVADSRKIFLEGIPFPSAIAVGLDGLWLGAPPNLLFVPDRNRDDKADMDDIEVRLTGWGIRDRHETLNSFHWGPDGWLYGCQGFATPSKVGKPRGKGRLYKHKESFPTFEEMTFDGEPVDINGGVFRYHPTKDRFEVVAHGFSNPWGIDYDAKGQLFISACVIPHLWHVIPGGIYHRQGGTHFNPYVYKDIRTIADHRHRSAHGGARVYISDAFPEQYHDRIFMANIHEHAVLTDVLEPNGSGFIGKHGDDFLLANNAQWIGFSMEIGPEGGVYVLDWHDADICGKDVFQKETGRVFRVIPTESRAEDWEGRYGDLTKESDLRLAQLQHSKSAWHARRARVILQNRSRHRKIDDDAKLYLDDVFNSSTGKTFHADYRLRSLWTQHVTGQLTEERLLGALSDRDDHIRAWAIQLLCEDMAPSRSAMEAFVEMAANDESPVVRLYLASALQRLGDSEESLAALAAIVGNLVARGEDADDHNIPKLIWFGIEALVPQYPQEALNVANLSRQPLVTRQIARRLTDADMLEHLVAAIGSAPREHTRRELLDGMRDGMEGRFDATPPSNWSAVYAKLQSMGEPTAQIATGLAQQFGDTDAARKLMTTLRSESADIGAKQEAIRGLAGRQRPELKEELIRLLDNDDLRRSAIRATASFDDRRLARQLLGRYNEFSVEDKLEVVQALASRSVYGRELTRAIKDEDIPRRDVPAYVARQLQRVVGNGFLEVWGSVEALTSENVAAIEKYRTLLTGDALAAADKSRGREIFKRTCIACHKLYGEGGQIGPDITGANRPNLEYVLSNILAPSAVIQDAYKMTLVVMLNGRTYSGIVAAENERQLRLRVAGEDEPVIISKSQIEEREVAPVSMMPEGLLRNLSDKEVIDLVAYLQSTQQVPLP